MTPEERAKRAIHLESYDWPDDTGEGQDELIDDLRENVAQEIHAAELESAKRMRERCAQRVAGGIEVVMIPGSSTTSGRLGLRPVSQDREDLAKAIRALPEEEP